MPSIVEVALLRARSIAPGNRTADVPALTERELSRIWEGQLFPKEALVSQDGRRLRVIYRGRASAGRGPDYRDALVSCADGLLKGDVELHVRSSDFQRHGHDRDPAYNAVVLHIVFRHDSGGATVLASGDAVPVVALGDWVDRRTAAIRRRLESTVPWQEPCYSAADRLGVRQTGETLDRLGLMRFRQKVAMYARALSSSPIDDALWAGLLEALGYGGDRPVFRELASQLPWKELQRRLYPLPRGQRAAAAHALLASAAGAVSGGPPAAGALSIRPANRPGKRLAGAAALAARFASTGIAAAVADLWHDDARATLGPLIARFEVKGTIGRSRAIEILCNVVLPCLAASAGDGGARAEALLARLPLPARYGAVRHLHAAVGSAAPIDARRQQGMVYLLQRYCTQGGCGRCLLS